MTEARSQTDDYPTARRRSGGRCCGARRAGGALAVSGGFTDVADNHPLGAEIARAVTEGWVHGYDDGTFRPDQRITPGQVVKIIGRATPDGMTRAEAVVFVAAGVDALVAEGSDATERHWTGESPGDPCSGPRSGLVFNVRMDCLRQDCQDAGRIWHHDDPRPGWGTCREPGWTNPDRTIQAGEDIDVVYGAVVTIRVPDGPDCRWSASGRHDPVTGVMAGTGVRTVSGGGSFTLIQLDPVTRLGGSLPDDNLTIWTYHVTCGTEPTITGVVTFDEAA